MRWNPSAYGEDVANLLALAGDGERLMPLAEGSCCSPEAFKRLKALSPQKLFSSARSPRAAFSGLYLYFSCRDEAHEASQSDSSAEGSYWHAIVHRQEPDAGNSSYWFGQAGRHPVFAPLLDEARSITRSRPGAALEFSQSWDPFAFIEVCERARRNPDSELERAALEIQRAEWQLLFHHCARRSSC